MERFCKFTVHEYMDMYPRVEVITFTGETLEEISNNARKWATEMSHSYSGGTTSFNQIFTAEEARLYLDTEISKIHNPDAADKAWIETINSLYNKCYKLC